MCGSRGGGAGGQLRRDLLVGKGRDARALRRVLDGDRADASRRIEVEQRVLIEVARFWLREYDVDGFRLDVADGPGPDFWSYFWPAVKAEKADCGTTRIATGSPVERMMLLFPSSRKKSGARCGMIAPCFVHTRSSARL